MILANLSVSKTLFLSLESFLKILFIDLTELSDSHIESLSCLLILLMHVAELFEEHLVALCIGSLLLLQFIKLLNEILAPIFSLLSFLLFLLDFRFGLLVVTKLFQRTQLNVALILIL